MRSSSAVTALSPGAATPPRPMPSAPVPLAPIARAQDARQTVEAPRRCWFRKEAVPEPLDPRARLVCSSPKVWVIDNFLTPEAARAIIAEHNPKVVPSRVVNKGNNTEVQKTRTSSSVALNPIPPVTAFKTEVAKILGIDESHMEPLAMIRYQAGQEYRPHYDWFNEEEGSQREWTVLIYLNDVDPGDGGETAFLGTGTTPLLVQPKAGRAVIWRNLLPSGFVDTKTLHAGLPPRCGSKYAINVWTRTSPFFLPEEVPVAQVPLVPPAVQAPPRTGPTPRVCGPSHALPGPVEMGPPLLQALLRPRPPATAMSHPAVQVALRQHAFHPHPGLVNHQAPGPGHRPVVQVRPDAERARLSQISMRTGPPSAMSNLAAAVPHYVS
eukprot:CAMPEP_0194492708 /NCGR_PEP_ID=MMETSP0253-20130528/11171_1 /TAXON_ID=2966 /ORGANISM="Noctiluca scintillans" /LENGTH=381 /DNA_ID=CAMNT_0039333611 /DNA_START=1 /DNA_END=1146 /DNA_ORIENTATION=+